MNLREGKIGTREGVAVLSAALLSKLLVPLFSTGLSGAAWLSSVSAAIVAAAGFMMALYISREDGLSEGIKHGLGVIGRLFSLALCALLLFNAARTLSAFHLVLKTFVYAETDSLVLMGLLTLAAAVPAYMGFECAARTAKAFFAVMLLVLALMLILPSTQYELSKLFPLWGGGLKQTLLSGASGSLAYLDITGAAVLMGALHGKAQARRVGLIALGVSALAASMMLLSAALTFPPGALSGMTAPFYSMASGVAITQAFTRVEDYLVFLWIMCAAAGLSFTLYVASNVFCRAVGVTEIRPVIPLASLIALLTALLMRASPIWQAAERFLMEYGFILAFGPIALAVLIAFIRSRTTAAKAKAAQA